MPKPQFRPIAALNVDDAALARVNESLGVPTLVRAGKPETPAPRPARARQEKLTVKLPAYLMDAVRREALDRRVTVRHLLMIALQQIGMTIDPADMVPDGRRSKT